MSRDFDPDRGISKENELAINYGLSSAAGPVASATALVAARACCARCGPFEFFRFGYAAFVPSAGAQTEHVRNFSVY
jgi:hypothetical protein